MKFIHEHITMTNGDREENKYETEDGLRKLRTGSILSYFYSELTRGYTLTHDEAKYAEKQRRIHTFFIIPIEVEKFMTYGFFQCVDAFLYIFTFLPLRFIVALLKLLIKGTLSLCLSQPGRVLEPAQICDLVKGLVLIVCYVLLQHVDVSMLYHLIRAQSIIKLYLFFNMLEVGDRLFASFGQDMLDALVWSATIPAGRKRDFLRVLFHFALAIVYVFLHGVLILCQATTLNVAFNSQNKSLLTIMMSNNFVELKGSVFKKFEKNNLFQMSCSDVRERFHFLVLLAVVCIRNLTEFSWDMAYFWVLIPDMLLIMFVEFLVDWIKHAFITKFNEISDEVYKEYTTSLAYDMVQTRQTRSHSDHMDVISRRMGFTPLPLAVILMRIICQSFQVLTFKTWILLSMFYFCLVTLKVLNSIILLGKACDYTLKAKKQTVAATNTHQNSKSDQQSHQSNDSNKTHNLTRRLSDPSSKFSPGVQEVLTKSCMKRSTSISGKLNVTFRKSKQTDLQTVTTASSDDLLPVNANNVLENNLQSREFLFSNSTVSLQSVGLNEEYIEDTKLRLSENKEKLEDGENELAIPKNEGNSELKHRKPPPKPLSEVDRYTMCSNRIV